MAPPLFKLFFLLLATICSTSTATPIATRIVGGVVSHISKHPYVVSIRIKSCSTCSFVHTCGGSIHSDKVVITAAQCLLGLGSNDRLMVVAGANTRTGSDGVQFLVDKTITHSGYHFWTIDNDIGLVVLKHALTLSDFKMKPIAIGESAPLGGKMSTVAGWGRNAEDGEPSYFLHDADIPIVSNKVCEESYGSGEITENMICAGLLKGGKDACQYDTGGPLVVDGELVGLVSWGRGCAREGYPGVYTSVASHTKWIAEKVAEVQKSF